jgi:acetyl esterase/lipase
MRMARGTVVVVLVPCYKHSVMFHLEGMPSLCLLHGKDDELVLFSHRVMLDQELTRRGMPHEFYSYEGLKHYFLHQCRQRDHAADVPGLAQLSMQMVGRQLTARGFWLYAQSTALVQFTCDPC